MILRDLCDVYTKTATISDSGFQTVTKTKAFSSVAVSIQPLSLNEIKLNIFGGSDLTANNRKIFSESGFLSDLCIIQDLKTSIWYEVRNLQPWPQHDEGLLYPLQGGQVTQ